MDVRAILRPSNHDVEICLYCGSRHLQGSESSTLGGVGRSEAKINNPWKAKGENGCEGCCKGREICSLDRGYR